MTTLIIVADIMDEKSPERNDLEGFEDSTFENITQFLETSKMKVEWYTLYDFMTLCNNDMLSVQNLFISYINVKNYSSKDIYTRCGT